MPGETILLVDDEEDDLRLMRTVLEGAGHSVIEAVDFDTAMECYEQHRDRITFLLADVALPGNNGCVLAQSILRDRPLLKVLFVSGHVGSTICNYYGLKTADRHFLRKPFSTAELVDAVDRVVNSRDPFPGFNPAPAGVRSR